MNALDSKESLTASKVTGDPSLGGVCFELPCAETCREC